MMGIGKAKKLRGKIAKYNNSQKDNLTENRHINIPKNRRIEKYK
jgi:hypothetical protein